MIYLYSLAGIGLLASFLASKEKTILSVKAAIKSCLKMLPLLLTTLGITSIVLFFLPGETIAKYLGGNNLFLSSALAALIGSVSLLPGFITFPLSGLLLKQGVAYTVIAAFTTSLMMVGIVTYPIEKEYFGKKITLLRNGLSFMIAMAVSLAIALVYKELI